MIESSESPLVSVVIPAYNAQSFIQETLLSVKNQTYTHLEIIVINDGSTDETEKIAQNIAKSDARITIISIKNSGVSAARNTGISKALGHYIVLLDADDLLAPASIAERLKKITTSNFGLVHCDMMIIDEKGSPTGPVKSGIEGNVLDDLLAWKKTVIPTPSSVMFRKDIVNIIGGFDSRLSNNADQEFFYRVASRFSVGRVSEPLGMYRIHLNQMHKNVNLMYSDTKIAYKLALENGLFKSKGFRRKCFSRMYFILANCYLKDAKKPLKAFILYFRGFLSHPLEFITYLK
jgi:glycosyltransferase involved in cell wall biosynthesis